MARQRLEREQWLKNRAAYGRQRREMCKKYGLCLVHKDVPVAPGHTRCAACLQHRRETEHPRERERRLEAKRAGMCILHHKRRAAPGRVYCRFCLRRKVVDTLAMYKRREANLQCLSHPDRMPAPNRVRCEECLEIRRNGHRVMRQRERESAAQTQNT